MPLAITEDTVLEKAPMRRVSWRRMPFLMLVYLFCYIDRVNVGFASLRINQAVKNETGRFPLALIRFVAAVGTICLLVIGRSQPRTMAVRTQHP